MNISINSFPRSGSQFTRLNLNRIIGQRIVEKIPPAIGNIRKDKSYFQIVTIRNPRDTVFSLVSHWEYLNPGIHKDLEQPVINNLKMYSESIDSFNENMEYISLYDFNYLEWSIFDIANKLDLKIPDNFVLKNKTDGADPNLWSIKNTDFYKKLLEYEMEDSLFDEANEKYQEILKICQRPS